MISRFSHRIYSSPLHPNRSFKSYICQTSEWIKLTLGMIQYLQVYFFSPLTAWDTLRSENIFIFFAVNNNQLVFKCRASFESTTFIVVYSVKCRQVFLILSAISTFINNVLQLIWYFEGWKFSCKFILQNYNFRRRSISR